MRIFEKFFSNLRVFMKFFSSLLINVVSLTILLSFSQLMTAQEKNQLITELNVFDNDSTFKYSFIYNHDGKKSVENKYKLEKSHWIRSSQKEWNYEGENCISQTERKWDGSQWKPTYTIEYRYENNLMTSESHYEYVNQFPRQISKIECFYENGRLISKKTYQLQDGTLKLQLELDYKYTTDQKIDSLFITSFSTATPLQYRSKFNYNLLGNVETQLLEKKNENGIWTKDEATRWYYNADSGQLTEQRKKRWNADFNFWENVQKTVYEYDNHYLKSEYSQYWNLMFWENAFRYEYNYDTSGNLLNKILYLPIYNVWRKVITINYNNYEKGVSNVMESKYNFWGGSTDELVASDIPFLFNDEIDIRKAQRIEVGYSTFVDTITNSSNPDRIPKNLVYPNPSEGIFYLDTRHYKIQSFEVSNLSGKLLVVQNQPQETGIVDLTDLPRGIYIIKIQTIDNQIVQKIIKK